MTPGRPVETASHANEVTAAGPDNRRTAPRLYLIRHGETAWSLTGQHTGRTDLPLTAHGDAQARALAPGLAAISFAHVLASPLQRARRTCILAGLGAAAIAVPDLAEWEYGDDEGKTSSEIRSRRPGWNAYLDGCPGGESPDDISARADRLIGHLCTLEGNVALFSHGAFGAALAARWIGLAVSEGRHLWLDTASLSILAHHPNHPDMRALALWNAVPAFLS